MVVSVYCQRKLIISALSDAVRVRVTPPNDVNFHRLILGLFSRNLRALDSVKGFLAV